MRRMCYMFHLLLLLQLCALPYTWAREGSACLMDAESEIKRAPDKAEMFVTTSHVFKRHLAQYFCAISGNLTVLELGIYHGHTTAVLAAMFRRVISVDVEKTYLDAAAAHTNGLTNVVFLRLNLMADDWQAFTSNSVDVVVIDANHKYEYVRADAHNALRYFPSLKFLVFDDFGHEKGVQETVSELEDVGVLVECQGLGQGWDGSAWKFLDWDERTGKTFWSWTNKSEGRVCKRGEAALGMDKTFLNQRFYIYRQPLSQLCSVGLFRFLPDGRLLSSPWGSGEWTISQTSQDRYALLQLPEMSPSPVEIFFNSRRTAFVLSELDAPTSRSEWFGIRDDLVHQPFEVAGNHFHD